MYYGREVEVVVQRKGRRLITLAFACEVSIVQLGKIIHFTDFKIFFIRLRRDTCHKP